MTGSWKLLVCDPRFEIDVIVDDLATLAALAVTNELARCGVVCRPGDQFAMKSPLMRLIRRSVIEMRARHSAKEHSSSKASSRGSRSRRAFKPVEANWCKSPNSSIRPIHDDASINRIHHKKR